MDPEESIFDYFARNAAKLAAFEQVAKLRGIDAMPSEDARNNARRNLAVDIQYGMEYA